VYAGADKHTDHASANTCTVTHTLLQQEKPPRCSVCQAADTNTTPWRTASALRRTQYKHMAPTHKNYASPRENTHKAKTLCCCKGCYGATQVMRAAPAYDPHVSAPHPLCIVRDQHMAPVKTHTKPRLSAAAKGAAVQRIGGVLPQVMRSPAAYV